MDDEMKWTCIRHGKDCTACSICHKEELSKSQSRIKELEEQAKKSWNGSIIQRQNRENEKLKSELGEAVEVIKSMVDVHDYFGTEHDPLCPRAKAKLCSRCVGEKFLTRHEKGEK